MQMAKEKEHQVNADSHDSESRSALESFGLESKISTRHLNFYYGTLQALFDNNLEIAQNRVNFNMRLSFTSLGLSLLA